jgi:Ser/Thr protein kinase RdoA (MazF antagonist)
VNTTLLVETSEGLRVLRVSPPERRRVQVEFEVTLLHAARERGARVARVLPGRGGAALVEVGGRVALWFEHLDGQALSAEAARRLPAQRLVELLRPLRAALAEVRPGFRPVAETHVFRAGLEARCRELERAGHARAAGVAAARHAALRSWEASLELPTSALHGDLHPGNVLGAAGGLWVVDFDSAHVGWRALDWVLPALEFARYPDGSIDEARYGELLSEFCAGAESAEEHAALPRLRQLAELERACRRPWEELGPEGQAAVLRALG